MKRLPLRRSPEYQARVRHYAKDLAERYRPEIADVFLANVKAAEKRLHDNSEVGTAAPYLLAGHHVVLKEVYFDSGPVTYCLIYEVTGGYVNLITLWHGLGSRNNGTLTRIWRRDRFR